MTTAIQGEGAPDALESGLQAVRAMIAGAVASTPLASLPIDAGAVVAGGKMLRGRLALRVGPAAGADPDAFIRAAAAIEMVHGASLLHDDVIDGGRLRRGQPAFWVQFGAQGAILAGDVLLCAALGLLRPLADRSLTDELIAMIAETCAAETEQELIFRGAPVDWDTGVRLARSKTGALFAFVAFAAAAPDPDLRAALKESGYLAGTAYQLSDDVLDVTGDSSAAGKTLGLDSARLKGTAASACNGEHASIVGHLELLRGRSADLLARWPAVRAAWTTYWNDDLLPAMRRNVGGTPVPAVPG